MQKLMEFTYYVDGPFRARMPKPLPRTNTDRPLYNEITLREISLVVMFFAAFTFLGIFVLIGESIHHYLNASRIVPFSKPVTSSSLVGDDKLIEE